MSISSKGSNSARVDGILNPILKIPDSEDVTRRPKLPRVTHFGILCDGPLCAANDTDPIQDVRYKCSICPDRDFCGPCVRHPDNDHDRTHALFECPDEFDFARAKNVATGGMEKSIQFSARRSTEPAASRRASEEIMGSDKLTAQPNASEIVGRKQSFFIRVPANILTRRPRVQHHHDPQLLAEIMLGKVTRYNYSQDKVFRSAQPGGPAVRLFDLHPGGNTDRLRITFRVIWLNDPPAYEALSYAWREGIHTNGSEEPNPDGNEDDFPLETEPTYAVYVDDSYFIEVSIGLRYALRALRDRHEVRTLWCDQLSVNQSNLAEKSAQVQAMAAIFGHAANVIVWMGHQDEHTKTACALIEQLADRCNCLEHRLPSPRQFRQHEEVLTPFPKDDQWVSLAEFFERLVFSRTWVIQEVTLAQRVIVKCGIYELEWWKMVNLARLLCQPSWASEPWRARCRPRKAGHLIGHVYHMDRIRNAFHSGMTAALSLSDLLFTTYGFQATNPRDKVFALLSICEVPSADNEDQSIKLDYTQSPIEIFTTTSRYILVKTKTLDILEFRGVSSMKGLPTWAADWTAPSQTYWTYNSRYTNNRYQAAGDSEVLVVWPNEDQPHLLATSSFLLGRVIEVCRFIKGERGVDKKLHRCATLASGDGKPYPTGELAVEALLSTFRLRACEFWSKRAVEPEEYEIALAFTFLNHLLPATESTSTLGLKEIRDYLEECTDGKLPELAEVEKGNSSGKFRELCRHAESWLRGVCTDHVFFLTDNGYIAQGPPRTEIGDEVHVISGGALPFLVRTEISLDNEQHHHSLIGATYVHGMMHGEALLLPDFSWSELYLR